MEKRSWENRASMLICVAFGIAVAILGIRYLFPILLPFLVAWGLSLLIRPMSHAIASRFGISRKVCSIVLFAVLLGGIVFLIYLATSRLLHELEQFLQNTLEEDRVASLISPNNDLFSFAAEAMPFLNRFSGIRSQFNDVAGELLSNLVTTLSSQLPRIVGGILSSLPSLFLVMIVTVIAGFYFCLSEGNLLDSFLRYLPIRIQKRIPHWKSRIKHLSWRFLRAYLLLLLLTFGLLFVGFLILDLKYAFLLALIVALVDMLPVLGVGTVLVPWAIVSFLGKHYFLGTGLLILYAVVLIVRQICEPKLLGGSLGLHPLYALFATFAGWQLFGFLGMLLGPLAAVLFKMLFESYAKNEG